MSSSTNDSARLPATAPATATPNPAAQHTVSQRLWLRPLAVLGLAAGVALLALASSRWLNTEADGFLLWAWMALWALLFVGCLVLSGTTGRMSQRVAWALNQWARRRALARADARFLALAQHDARLQAELRMQQDRQSAAAG